MAKRNVIWTKTADMQFVSILGYWVKRNKSNTYSKKLVKLVTERTTQFAETPFIFKATDFNGVRIASLGNFSIYFKVTEVSIIVSAFWDNRQDPKKLLKILQNEK